MSSRQAPTGDFDTDLTQLLPRLRIYALSLTRDPVRADDLRYALLMAALAGHSHVTIAGASGVSVGTIKSRVSRAGARLRHMLDLDVGDFSLAAPSYPASHAVPVA